MNPITQAWNWKPEPSALKTVRARALQAGAGFLAMMVCCTLVSRTADSITVPVVSTEEPRRMAIVKTFAAEGSLEAMGGVPVLTTSGLPVLEMSVSEGDRVEAGQLLFTCDISEVQRQISQLNLDILGMKAELAQMEEEAARSAQQSQQEQERNVERALEDYESAARLADQAVEEAAGHVTDARRALDKYRGIGRHDYDEEEYTEEEHRRLQSAYRSAQLAYEAALANQEDALRNAQRKVDDAARTEASQPGRGGEIKRISLQKLQLELSALLEAAASKGEVYAPISGILTDLSLATGRRTSGEAAAIIRNEESLRFTAQVTQEQAKLISPGDYFSLSLGSKQKAKDVMVLSVTQSPDDPSLSLVTAEPSLEVGRPGQYATAEFTWRSEVYGTVLPLSALYGSDNNYYVLVVQERSTVLGSEYAAVSYPVTLLERNEEYAALSGVPGNLPVIVSGDKPVRDGDRIRLL